MKKVIPILCLYVYVACLYCADSLAPKDVEHKKEKPSPIQLLMGLSAAVEERRALTEVDLPHPLSPAINIPGGAAPWRTKQTTTEDFINQCTNNRREWWKFELT